MIIRPVVLIQFIFTMLMISSCASSQKPRIYLESKNWSGVNEKMNLVNPYKAHIPIDGIKIKCSGRIKFPQSDSKYFNKKIVVNAWPLVVNPDLPSIGIMSFTAAVSQDDLLFDHLDGAQVEVIGRLYDRGGRSLVLYDVQYIRVIE